MSSELSTCNSDTPYRNASLWGVVVLLLIHSSTSVAATETLDLNSASEGATLTRTIQSSTSFANAYYGAGKSSCVPYTQSDGLFYAGAVAGFGHAQYWATEYPGASVDTKLFSRLAAVPTAPISGIIVPLQDFTTGAAVPGWSIRWTPMGFPYNTTLGPGNKGTDVDAGLFSYTLTLVKKGDLLLPGHAYGLPATTYQIRSTCWSKTGHNTITFTSSAYSPTGNPIVQADASTARITQFHGTTIDAGSIADNMKLGEVQTTVVGGIPAQTAAVRWDPATRGQPAPPYADSAYNKLTADGHELVVGLQCPGTTWEADPAGGVSYAVSTGPSLQCDIVKAGTGEVRAGEYKMSIQAAVRTP